ncbi:MAG: hypothetical protein IJQ23_04260 [Clostridia bacterium]|nr:hypothetical protein [Clostridia bacterium]
MSNLTERIESLHQATAARIVEHRKTPLVICGKNVKAVYMTAFPKCPYGNEYFPTIIKKGVVLPFDGAGVNTVYYTEAYFEGLKKPGFFSKKKPQEVEVFWVNKKILDYSHYVVCDALKRDNQSKLPASTNSHYRFCATSLDAGKFKAWCNKLKRTVKEDTVLMTFGDLDDVIEYNVAFNMGDLYQKKLIPQGQTVFYNGPISNALTDAIVNVLKGIGFIGKSRVNKFFEFTLR